jgi:hypothetical protein
MGQSMFRIITVALAVGTMLVPFTASADGLEVAQREYYNARYESAARLTQDPCATDVNGVAACELRTAALLFQIKAALGSQEDKDKVQGGAGARSDLGTRANSRGRGR